MKELISEERLMRAEEETREEARKFGQEVKRQHWLFRYAGHISIVIAIIVNAGWELSMEELTRISTKTVMVKVASEHITEATLVCQEAPQKLTRDGQVVPVVWRYWSPSTKFPP